MKSCDILSLAANFNFDSLMVPFRCMAADVAKNEPVMLKEGSLGAAVRASSTYPFYFKPITINGKLLFDSGYKACLRKIPEIRSFLVDSISPADMKNKRTTFTKKKPDELIDNFYINGLDNKLLVPTHRNDRVVS